MTPKGGKRIGAGRKPALHIGERKHFYLAPDLVEWWDSLPEREKSGEINQAIRDTIALANLLNSEEQTPEKKEAILTNQVLKLQSELEKSHLMLCEIRDALITRGKDMNIRHAVERIDFVLPKEEGIFSNQDAFMEIPPARDHRSYFTGTRISTLAKDLREGHFLPDPTRYSE